MTFGRAGWILADRFQLVGAAGGADRERFHVQSLPEEIGTLGDIVPGLSIVGRPLLFGRVNRFQIGDARCGLRVGMGIHQVGDPDGEHRGNDDHDKNDFRQRKRRLMIVFAMHVLLQWTNGSAP